MIDITKMNCCDFCFDEAYKCKRSKRDINHRDWQFKMNHKVLNVCREHMNELYECLNKMKENGEI